MERNTGKENARSGSNKYLGDKWCYSDPERAQHLLVGVDGCFTNFFDLIKFDSALPKLVGGDRDVR